MSTAAASSPQRPTLVFGLVAAVGTDLSQFMDTFCELLRKYAYEPVRLHLTELLKEHVAEAGSLSWENEAERLEVLMTAGDDLRENLERGDAVALLAALGVAEHRKQYTKPAPAAYVVRQLKHPEEIAVLRRIYGDRYFSVALYSTFDERLDYLKERKNIDDADARRLIKRDEEDETNDYGQRTRDAFELADVFIRLNHRNYAAAQAEAQRFLDLLFGKPDLSPKTEEHAMYLAYAASLRSADLSRQVGASILSAKGDVVAVGANDVPCSGGGQYWPGDADQRDHRKGVDSNYERKMEIARDIFRRVRPDSTSDEEFRAFLDSLKGSLLLDITEYGRAVHAEMEALLSCARSGVSTRDAALFSTTFPCHNCAKHIVGAGVRTVFYVEPYPKSLASPLHGDSIVNEDDEQENSGRESDGKVMFRHYVGIGPRRYIDLFSLTLSSGRRVRRKAKGAGSLAEWERSNAQPRVPSEKSSDDLEAVAISELNAAMGGAK
jgi:deoxycytidylate deaminase